MAEWNAVLTDLAGKTRAFPEIRDLQMTPRVNSFASATGSLQLSDEAVLELLPLQRALKLYRDGVLRFYGRIVPPVRYAPGVVTFTAADPLFLLAHRLTQPDDLYGADQAGAAAWGLIETQNLRPHGNLYLRQGLLQTSPLIDQDFSDGRRVSDALLQGLVQVDNGVWVRVDAVDDDPEVHGELVVLYPDPGPDRSNTVRFEYGDGTAGTLEDYAVEDGMPRNGVTATGASFGAGAETVRRDDDPSQSLFGILEDTLAFTDETDPVALDQHADESLILAPPRTYSVTPLSAKDDEATGAIRVPALYEDFYVGDQVGLKIVDRNFVVPFAPIRISEATIAVSNDSKRETLTNLVLGDKAA